MMRVVNLWKEPNWYVWEDQNPRWRDRHEAVRVKQGVDSRDEVRQIKQWPKLPRMVLDVQCTGDFQAEFLREQTLPQPQFSMLLHHFSELME